MGYIYFAIRSGLPRPMVEDYLDSMFNDMKKAGPIDTVLLVSAPNAAANIIGVAHEVIITRVRNMLERFGVGFEESFIRPANVAFEEWEITIATLEAESLADMLSAFFNGRWL